MKTKNCPWLNSDRKEVSTKEIKKISKDWSAETWEEFLSTQEYCFPENLISEKKFKTISEYEVSTIFEQNQKAKKPFLKSAVASSFLKLPAIQREILKNYFWRCISLRQISENLGLHLKTVQHHLQSALFKLEMELADTVKNPRVKGQVEIPKPTPPFEDQDLSDVYLCEVNRHYPKKKKTSEMENL